MGCAACTDAEQTGPITATTPLAISVRAAATPPSAVQASSERSKSSGWPSTVTPRPPSSAARASGMPSARRLPSRMEEMPMRIGLPAATVMARVSAGASGVAPRAP